MISDFAIKRPISAIVFNLLLITFGIIAFTLLPLREYPDINPPIISINTQYTGASSEIVESKITQLIENRISGIEGIKTIESSSQDGRSQITIEFTPSRDIDNAANDIRDRVSRILDDLPDEADAPEISKVDANEDVIVWYNVASTTLSELELTDYAERFLVDRLAIIDGVARVRIGGERRYAIRLWINPLELAARHLTIQDIEHALRNENVELPAGRFESINKEYTLRIERSYRNRDDFKKLIVKRGPSGGLVRLGDVAKIELGSENDRTELRGNGQPMIGLGVVKQTQANTLAVAKGVRDTIDSIKTTLPDNIQIHDSYDSSVFVDIAIKEVYKTLIIAIALVALVIFVFLGQGKLTLIPMLTVPVALMSSFIALYVLGYSINILTLLALVLAIGIVVDDSIVVLENNYRRFEAGEAPVVASYKGTKQVAFAVIVTTISVVAVFTPIIFLQGTTGKLFSEFVGALCAAVIASSFTALTLSPVLTTFLLKDTNTKHKNRFKKHFDALFATLEQTYKRFLTWVMDFPRIMLAIFCGLLGLCALFIKILPTEFSPQEDRGAFFVFVNGPEGSSYTYMHQKMLEVEQRLNFLIQEKLATRLLMRVPRSFSNSEIVNNGIIIVVLNAWGSRPPAQDIMARVQKEIGQISGVQAFPVMRSGLARRGTQRPIQFVIGGSDYQTLAKWRDILLEKLENNPFLTRLDYDYKETKPKYILTVNRDLAAELGVTTQDIGRTLETLYASRKVTTFFQNGEEYDVILQAPRENRQGPLDLSKIYLRSSITQRLVPLPALISLAEQADSASLNRYNRIRSITLSANLQDGVTLGEALTYLQDLTAEHLPPEVIIDYKGESLDFVESTGENVFVFIIAFVVIFLVLAAQFESFVHPWVIILGVPTAILGATIGLFITMNTLNIFSTIALIMLVGLASKNGILIVEFINQLRDEGYELKKAIIEGSRLRFRPILMTSLSTLMSAVPLILSFGAGAESRATIGIAIFSGMLLSTGLILIFIPVFYQIFAAQTTPPKAYAKALEQALASRPKKH